MGLQLELETLSQEVKRPLQQIALKFPLGTQDLQDGSVTDAKLATSIIRGEVTAAGAVGNGTGFTVVRNSAGNYTVTFTTAFSATPVVTASFCDGGIFAVRVSAISASAATFITFNGAGAGTDSKFDFIAISV